MSQDDCELSQRMKGLNLFSGQHEGRSENVKNTIENRDPEFLAQNVAAQSQSKLVKSEHARFQGKEANRQCSNKSDASS